MTMQCVIGVVIIGRNEGDRLRLCLESVKKQLPSDDCKVVYVDSCSTDGSCELAESFGTDIIRLDTSVPLTAARARNAGFNHITQQYPDIEYVQFIDGDCELADNWLSKAYEKLTSRDELAIVCGRRTEKFPEKSVYNQLMDMEWDTPVGVAKYCGGDSLVKVKALKQVDGFRADLICGEEPDMCIRLRKHGWEIERIDALMTFHDAAIYKFSQWWKRAVRGGWAVAEGVNLHGNSDEQYMKREHVSGILWGFALPFVAIFGAWLTDGASLFLLLAYILLAVKIYRYRVGYGDQANFSFSYAVFCVISKFPQLIGQLNYWMTLYRSKDAMLIEYK